MKSGKTNSAVIVEPTGAETQVMFKLDSIDFVAIFHERVAVEPGETIRIKPDPESVHLFDPESGQRFVT